MRTHTTSDARGYTSDTRRAFDTAKLLLKESGQPTIEICQDARLREWCLGTMEAEKNKAFIDRVSGWLGGITSFSEMNRRLPEVAAVQVNKLNRFALQYSHHTLQSQ